MSFKSFKTRLLCFLTDCLSARAPLLFSDGSDAMDKQPGVYSARFLGVDTSYYVKNQYIIEQVANKRVRDARFVCAMALVIPGSEDIVVEATMEGIINDRPQGHNGFGYDPILFYPPCNKTSGMMTLEEKNKHSHRAKALNLLVEKIKEIV